jgi:23S rRNA pseudouridine2605 synthase
MERYITQGRVTVNGRVAALGEKADPDRDTIALDGVPVTAPERRLCLMLNKPRGYVTTLSDDRGRRTVAELVSGCGARVWPVGRLDMDSEGLLLLTDDGALTYHLTHPSHEVEKEYETWVLGDLEAGVRRLLEPMELDGAALRTPRVVPLGPREGGAAALSITIHEGKNRQVRRMCAQAGLTVVRLKRVREGSLRLDRGLRPGQWRPLTAEELAGLRR